MMIGFSAMYLGIRFLLLLQQGCGHVAIQSVAQMAGQAGGGGGGGAAGQQSAGHDGAQLTKHTDGQTAGGGGGGGGAGGQQ